MNKFDIKVLILEAGLFALFFPRFFTGQKNIIQTITLFAKSCVFFGNLCSEHISIG
jgi:hypothetical protein